MIHRNRTYQNRLIPSPFALSSPLLQSMQHQHCYTIISCDTSQSGSSEDFTEDVSFAESPVPVDDDDYRKHLVLPSMAANPDRREAQSWLESFVRVVYRFGVLTMSHRNTLGSPTTHPAGGQKGSTNAANVIPSSHPPAKRPGKGKRASDDVGGADTASHCVDTERPIKKPRTTSDRPYACPFHQRDFMKYCAAGTLPYRNFQTCTGPGFANYQRVKSVFVSTFLFPLTQSLESTS